MAKTAQQIYDEMVIEAKRRAALANNAELIAMLDNSSEVAVWKVLFHTMAYCVWTLEVVFDKFVALVRNIIFNMVAHTPRWYRSKVLAFQYGFDLLPDSDKFDNSNATAQQIADSMVVKYCAVNETTVDGLRVLLIKVAGVDGDNKRIPLTQLQNDALVAYVQKIKDAGNAIIVYNRQADTLRAVVDVYYNPLVLDGNGNRLDGNGKPVIDAVNDYLTNLDFNGEFSIARFADSMQAAYGVSVRNVFIRSIERKTGNSQYQAVVNTFIPDAGYADFETNGLTINYVPHVQN
jgi:archaellin